LAGALALVGWNLRRESNATFPVVLRVEYGKMPVGDSAVVEV
jgi:hypothetical protein